MLVAAFVSGAAEVLVKPLRGSGQFFIGALDLWYTIWPGSLLVLQIKLENISPALWDPWALAVLSLPAWALLGTPGFVCIIVFRPRKKSSWRQQEEARKDEEQLMLYDELTREAHAQGLASDGDGAQPEYSAYDALLAVEGEMADDQEDFDKFIRDAGVAPRSRPAITTPEIKLVEKRRGDGQGPGDTC